MLKRKLALMLFLVPLIISLLSFIAEYSRVDANPPISVLADARISSISFNTDTTTTTYSYENYVPNITIHKENIVLPEPEFEPIGKYYDELKCGYLEFDCELQRYLWEKCNDNNTDFYIIMAQICEESTYDPDASHHNSNGTVDMGLSQINSGYLEYYEDLMNRDIDPYNPYDAIDFLVWRYNYDREYWDDITGNRLNMAILGSYNKGRSGMISYIKKHGYEYYYNRNIIRRGEQLIKEHNQDI